MAHFIAYFFAGMLLANALPHLTAGMSGRAFQTPFAKPPGRGLSSSLVNVLWGFFNLVLGYVLLSQVGDFAWKRIADVLPPVLGALAIALHLARHFGSLHGGRLSKPA